MKKILLLLCVSFFVSASSAQDTLRVMHYNLMYYNTNTGFCNQENNSVSRKDSCLKKIIQYIKPDIFTANEIGNNTSSHQRLLDSVLNTGGKNTYKMGQVSTNGGGTLSNGIFYNAEKFTLKSQTNVPTLTTRDINFYEFYFNAVDLGSGTLDTAFLTCIVAHLEPGNTNTTLRAQQIAVLMNYLDSVNVKSNYLVMGDFNVYADTEACYRMLITPGNADFAFYDPVDKPGLWSDEDDFRFYHTQSTHALQDGCFASGGMDDRFDFILQSEYIQNGTRHYQFLNNSYTTPGQDGNHFNKAINDGANSSAPADIIEALFNMSDHLPVYLDLQVDQTAGLNIQEVFDVAFPNPVTDILHLNVALEKPSQLDFAIINTLSQEVFFYSTTTTGTTASFEFPVDFLNQGIYFLTMYNGINKPITKKFMKK
ncbi:MAG TPA: T9SS type A sorting domain-containing protein [Bacteroidales bacterium]|nr:T9SS type A sorting domain-containing protein [Bacteroidales bacterium]